MNSPKFLSVEEFWNEIEGDGEEPWDGFHRLRKNNGPSSSKRSQFGRISPRFRLECRNQLRLVSSGCVSTQLRSIRREEGRTERTRRAYTSVSLCAAEKVVLAFVSHPVEGSK